MDIQTTNISVDSLGRVTGAGTKTPPDEWQEGRTTNKHPALSLKVALWRIK